MGTTLKKKLLGVFKYLMFLGLGIFLVWWSLHQIPDDKWDDFKKSFATARYVLLIPVFFIITLSHFLRALRWKILMEPMGYAPSLTNTFFAVMIGYLANLAVPRLGEILKCTLLAKYEKVPADKLVGTIVAERAFDLISLFLIFILAFIFEFSIVSEYATNLFNQLISSRRGELSFVKIAVIAIILILVVLIVRFTFKRFAHLKIVTVARKILKGIAHGIVSVKDVKRKTAFAFCSVGIWLLYLTGTWIGFYATIGTAGLPFQVALPALAFSSIGMIVTPGGIGAYAFFMAKVLEKYNVPFEQGFANGTLQWFAQFIIVIVLGFICLGLLPYFNKKKKTDAQSRYNPR